MQICRSWSRPSAREISASASETLRRWSRSGRISPEPPPNSNSGRDIPLLVAPEAVSWRNLRKRRAVPPVPVLGRAGVPLQRAGWEGLQSVPSRLDPDRRPAPDVRRVDGEVACSRRAGLTAARIAAARSDGTERIDRIACLTRSNASVPSRSSAVRYFTEPRPLASRSS